MTDSRFPNISKKLSAPRERSAFERNRAEAEAKRARDEAETAAVYEEFVKSLEDDSAPERPSEPRGFGHAFNNGPPSQPPGTKRRLGLGASPSGPPSDRNGQAPSFKKMRVGDERGGASKSDANKKPGIFGFDDDEDEEEIKVARPTDTGSKFSAADNRISDAQRRAAAKAASKPTLYLQCLPMGTSEAFIKSILPGSLKVESLKPMSSRPAGIKSTDRRSMSCIVTLDAETPGRDIDSAVNALQNKYLGFGFRLNISRHLSSATLGSNMHSMQNIHTSLQSQPFGATAVVQTEPESLNRAPPPPGQTGSAFQRSSFSGSRQDPTQRPTTYEVKVFPPSSLLELKLIHKTIEGVLTHGAEFEALLMSRPDVQRDEKWAWLFDARSRGGVWYRWRLWEIKSGLYADRERGPDRISRSLQHKVFEEGPMWIDSGEELPFEFVTNFEELVSDPDYDSSAEEESDDEEKPKYNLSRRKIDRPGGANSRDENQDVKYVDPMQKAKLIHLLARLPSTTAKLRRGDTARVTGFAINNAGTGADEVVEMLVLNVLKPFCLENLGETHVSEDDEDHVMQGIGSVPKNENALHTQAPNDHNTEPTNLTTANSDRDTRPAEKPDNSSAKQIGLYLINDILSASSTCGVRHAWRYRALFEACLVKHSVFAHLGRLDRDYNWGRIRADKWKRTIRGILERWEGWSAFDVKVHAKLVQSFENPPLTQDEQDIETKKAQEKKEAEEKAKKLRILEERKKAKLKARAKLKAAQKAAQKDKEKLQSGSNTDDNTKDLEEGEMEDVQNDQPPVVNKGSPDQPANGDPAGGNGLSEADEEGEDIFVDHANVQAKDEAVESSSRDEHVQMKAEGVKSQIESAQTESKGTESSGQDATSSTDTQAKQDVPAAPTGLRIRGMAQNAPKAPPTGPRRRPRAEDMFD